MSNWKTILTAALIAAGTIASSMTVELRAASPLDDAVKVWSFSDDTELKALGSVRAGVAMDGPDKAASLARGGDGLVARFEGGYFVTGDDAKVDGQQMTVLVRARSDDEWAGVLLARNDKKDRYANLLYGGAFTKFQMSSLDYRERQRIETGNI